MAAPESSSDTGIDTALVRWRFARAVGTPERLASYERAAALQREVGQRMRERLDYVKLEPAVVLDAGCGTGHALPGLAQRFPGSTLIALDQAISMLAQARRAAPAAAALPGWLRRWLHPRGGNVVAADFSRLPFPDGSIDCIWSNLAVHWSADPAATFAEWSRVLRTGGLLQFSLLGPDTLRELRAAWRGSPGAHVHRFVDMHDIGDMLVHAGLADPVMDMEQLTLTYPALDDLLAELRALGMNNADRARPRGLNGRRGWEAVRAAYETCRSGGTLPATFEVIYGHAWKPAPRPPRDGVARVRVEDIGRRRAAGASGGTAPGDA